MADDMEKFNKRCLTSLLKITLSCVITAALSNVATASPTSQPSNINTAANQPSKSSAVLDITPISIESKLNTDAGFNELPTPIDWSPSQKRSYYLLTRKFWQAHPVECFIFSIEKASHPDFPIEYQLAIYEKHSTQCGGDPNTQPLRALYYIDSFGRIFKNNISNAALDFQYQYNEKPKIITNIKSIKHPIRQVLEQHGVTLNKLEKRADNTFVVLYVDHIPKSVQDLLFNSLLDANGRWDFVIRSDNGDEYYIEGDKRKVIDEVSYLD